ncbi:hypothetical protein GA0061103_4852 [Rhizobium multihospitium]|uniref:Peptidase propeptide and YPEB domain-containing protein n=1 Tax=Rhizobium multihospitium TaxID=410764 RepID=A0A1C3W4R9_9HYPH|nr:hypothetical protein GA0061103_4852 [Rhizobium multihospitium]
MGRALRAISEEGLISLRIFGRRAGWPRWLSVLLVTALLTSPGVEALARSHSSVLVEDAGTLRPLREIYAVVAREMPGKVLRIKRVRRAGRQAYAVRVLKPDGKRGDIVLDGATLAVIERR